MSAKNFLVQGPCHGLHGAIVDPSKTLVLLSKESVLSCCKTTCVTLWPALFWVIYCAVFVCLFVCLYMFVCVCLYVCLCMFVCVYVFFMCLFMCLFVCLCVCLFVLGGGFPKSPALHFVMYIYCLLTEVLQHHRFWLDEDRTAAGVQLFYQRCRKFLAEKFCCLVLQWNACLSSCGHISAPLSRTVLE